MTRKPVEVSPHQCLIYDGHPSEQLPIIVPFLMRGLNDGWRCLYLGNAEMVEMIRTALLAKEIDVDSSAMRQALIFSSERPHLEGGRFEPGAMIRSLREVTATAKRDGFKGLCATGDMSWELGTEKNFDRLLEYESLLESAFKELPLRGICQYHKRTIPPRALRDAMLTHRSVYLEQTLVKENRGYIPPDLLARTLLKPS